MNILRSLIFFFFFFNDPATTDIYTLSLHDALPICFSDRDAIGFQQLVSKKSRDRKRSQAQNQDRKSTRLNSSHVAISYAVFCLKKKKNNHNLLAIRAEYHNSLK